MNDLIKETVTKYYTEKINEYGATPQGVDWKDRKGQDLRFKQLLKICQDNKQFTINDLGCGYGSLYEFLISNNYIFNYVGYDLSTAMIESAKKQSRNFNNAEFICSGECLQKLDYTLASGIFNVRMQISDELWQDYMLKTLHHMANMSNKGFAFNALTSYADAEYKRKDLFYSDPLFFFDYCKKNFSKHVALLHDYELYEFTLLVRIRE